MRKPAPKAAKRRVTRKPGPPATEWVHGADLAHRLGTTRQAVSAASKPGGRLQSYRRADGLYDLEACVAAWDRDRAHPAGPGRGNVSPPPPPEPEGLDDEHAEADDECPVCGTVRDLRHWKTLTAREEYETKRLARLELEGSLVKREVVEAEFAELAATTRSLLEKVASAVRDDLAAEDDPRRCGDIVDDEIRLALQQAAAMFAESAGRDLAVDDDMGEPVEEEGDE